jgi:hypothetical protein
MRASAVRALLLALIALAAWPVRWYQVTSGLDPSWAFAVNAAHARGWIFGRDVFFTYGPLAWLTLPMDVGANLWQGIAFQAVCWLLFMSVLGWLVFARHLAAWQLAGFAVCLLAGRRAFRHYDYVGAEFFLAFLALVLLGAAATGKRWYRFHAASWAIGVMLLFVKFTAGAMVLSAVALFAAGTAVLDRRKALQSAAAAAIGVPVLFAAGYLLYYPSASGLVRYVRAAFEVSSGFSTAMTDAGAHGPLLLALVIVASWVFLCAVLYRIRDRAFPIAFALLGPLFMLFKCSFVREPVHVGTIFAFTPLLWAVVVLFTGIGRADLPRLIPPLAILAAVICLQLVPTDVSPREPLTADRLPAGITSAIGALPVAIFPYECAYAPANGLRLRPFPVLQSYSAYTPFLDGLDAAFLEDGRVAPPLILFEWKSINGRNPLLDVPTTSLALYRHYDIGAEAPGYLLLRRRTAPRFASPRPVETRELTLGRPFTVPESRHPLIARIHFQLTYWGSVRKLLFRIPEVTLAGFRVPPEVMEDGVPLNFLPRNLEDVKTLLTTGAVSSHPTELSIGGPGSRYLRDLVKVEILEIPELDLPLTAQ